MIKIQIYDEQLEEVPDGFFLKNFPEEKDLLQNPSLSKGTIEKTLTKNISSPKYSRLKFSDYYNSDYYYLKIK